MSFSTSNQQKINLIDNSPELNIENPLERIIYISKSNLIKEYGPNCKIKYKYSYQIINNLVYHKRTHLNIIFKEKIITEYIDEFLKRYYRKRESHKKIPQFALFYSNYQKYFCTPTFLVKFYNKKIHRQREEKAKCFYNEKFKDKENCSNSESNLEMYPASMGGKPGMGKKHFKIKNEINNKTFFNEDVKELLEKESVSINCDINSESNNTISLNESGSKLKNNSSYLLNNSSKEESLCNIMNGLINKKIFEFNSSSDTKRSNKTLSQKNKKENENDINNTKDENNKNSSNKNVFNKNIIINNNLKLVLKKRVINIKNKNKNKNITNSNNYETFELNKKKGDNLSVNFYKKIGIQNLKIVLNNKEYQKTAKNKKSAKRIGLWNAINDNDKENKRVKSQDNNVINSVNNLLMFHKNKKVSRNISSVILYKKKSLPTNKSNISAKLKANEFDNIHIQNILKNHNIKNFTKKTNNSKDKIRNMKKKSYKPLRLCKSNININPNESLLNKIKKKVLEKRAYSRERLHLKNKGDNYEKNQKNLNYNTIKRFPNGLNIYYTNLNTNKYGNYMTKNYQRNNDKFELKSNQNIFKSNKLAKSPSISEFMRYIRIQKNISNSINKRIQRKYQTIENKTNNIQNLNININNQINIRLNNINEIPSESLNNKKFQVHQKLISKNKKGVINYNTNQNFVIKYNNNMPTFLSQNNYKPKHYRVFGNKYLLENNSKSIGSRNDNKFKYYQE